MAIDGSALVHRYVPGSMADRVAEVLEAHDHWVLSAMARAEVTATLLRLSSDLGPWAGAVDPDLRARLAIDWDGFWQIPVDDDALGRAPLLARDHGLGPAAAVQLGGFVRLGMQSTVLTADPSLALAADRSGFEKVELISRSRSAHSLVDDGDGSGRSPAATAWTIDDLGSDAG